MRKKLSQERQAVSQKVVPSFLVTMHHDQLVLWRGDRQPKRLHICGG
jgi:hypothetical protein